MWGQFKNDNCISFLFHFFFCYLIFFFFLVIVVVKTFMYWRRKCNPLQCSCLENPRDGGAWWAAVYGVAQSRTRLKRLSSSSSSGEESTCQDRRCKRCGFHPWVQNIPWSRKWQPDPEFLPWTEETGGLYSPWGCKESNNLNAHNSWFTMLC